MCQHRWVVHIFTLLLKRLTKNYKLNYFWPILSLMKTFTLLGKTLTTVYASIHTRIGDLVQAIHWQQSAIPNKFLISRDPNFSQDNNWNNLPDSSLDTIPTDALIVPSLTVHVHHGLHDVSTVFAAQTFCS